MILPHRTDISKHKIISSDKAAELLGDGWRKADLHVHTCCSYDVPPTESMRPESLLYKGMDRGLDFVTFTDHDTVRAYDILGWKREDLTPGVELSISDPINIGHTVHINVFGFDRQQYLEFDNLARKECNIYSVIDYLRSNDLPYMYNHPFWFQVGDRPNIFAIPELARHFPVIEYNMQDLKQKNLFAMVLAQRYGKGMAVTTDSHTGGIGNVYTIAQGDTFYEYFSNIRKGRSCMVVDQPIWKHITGELNAWIELIFSMRKDIREEMGFTTGMGAFDRLVSIMESDILERSPLVNNVAKDLIKHVSGSGLPVLLYMISKQPQVSKIGRMING